MSFCPDSIIETIDALEGKERALKHLEKRLEESANGADFFVRIKSGSSLYDREGWSQWLQSLSFLKYDDRQFDFKEQLVRTIWWEISNQPDKASSYAFSTTTQPLHCDNAWFSDPAEINFFIMEKQAIEGGAQTLYRLEDLMEDLKQDAPELLRKLTTVPVVIQKGNTDLANHTTIIQAGDNPRVFWNYYRTHRDTPEISEMCEQFFQWLKKQEKTDRVKTVRMDSGDCFFFNDQKMLHGRTAFKAEQPRERVLLQSMWKRVNAL